MPWAGAGNDSTLKAIIHRGVGAREQLKFRLWPSTPFSFWRRKQETLETSWWKGPRFCFKVASLMMQRLAQLKRVTSWHRTEALFASNLGPFWMSFNPRRLQSSSQIINHQSSSFHHSPFHHHQCLLDSSAARWGTQKGLAERAML